MPPSDTIQVYGDPIGQLSLLARHREVIMRFDEKVPSTCPSIFNYWLSTDTEEEVRDLQASKNISKAKHTPKRTVRPKDEVLGMEDLLDS